MKENSYVFSLLFFANYPRIYHRFWNGFYSLEKFVFSILCLFFFLSFTSGVYSVVFKVATHVSKQELTCSLMVFVIVFYSYWTISCLETILEGRQSFLERKKRLPFLVKIAICNSYLNSFLLVADWACIFQSVDSNHRNRCI